MYHNHSNQKKIEQSGHDLFIATAKWITKGRFFAGARAGIADIQPPPESTGNLTTASKVCTVGADGESRPELIAHHLVLTFFY